MKCPFNWLAFPVDTKNRPLITRFTAFITKSRTLDCLHTPIFPVLLATSVFYNFTMLITHIECGNHHYTFCFFYMLLLILLLFLLLLLGVVVAVVVMVESCRCSRSFVVKYELLHYLIFCHITICCFTTFSGLGYYRHDMDCFLGLWVGHMRANKSTEAFYRHSTPTPAHVESFISLPLKHRLLPL